MISRGFPIFIRHRFWFHILTLLGLHAALGAATGADVKPKDARRPSPQIVEVQPGIWRIRFGTPERFTPHALREAEPNAAGLKALPPAKLSGLALDQIRCEITGSRTTVYVPCAEASEQIYGFGLDPGAYQQRGLWKNLTVSASVMGKTGASHGPVPFYISTKGYGVYVDTARVPIVEVARLSPNQDSGASEATPESPATTEAELYQGRAVRGKTEIIFDLPGNTSGVDVYVFTGPNMREVVQRYNLFSGGGAMPPLWGLGLKYRTFTRADQPTVLKAAQALRELDIPCDTIGLEPGWQSHFYSCSFSWSKERFPDPDAMLRELKQQGFTVNLWEHAYVHPTSPMFAPLKARAGNYLVWGGLVVDFIDPKATKIFSDFHDEQLISKGIMGFKGDECDRQPPTDAEPFNFPYFTTFPSGIEGDQMTQLYGYLYQKSLFAPFKKRNLRTWSDVRATTALAAPLPFNLYSDAYSFEEYLRQLVNASFAGMLWSPEVREASRVAELLNRTAVSAYAPQMCLDMWFMPNPVWQQFDQAKNKAGDFLPDAEQKVIAERLRTIVRERYTLIPYLYAAFHKYRIAGLPPVRSLLLDFPDDQALQSVDDQFMFGDSLLAAPFLGQVATRQVRLPAGVDWYGIQTKQWHRGGTSVTVSGNPGDMPLFVRENSLVPFAEPVSHIGADTVFKITVRVYGNQPASFTLMEDDGTSFDFERGAMNQVKLSWDRATGGAVKRTGEFPKQRYEIKSWETIPKPN